jgi:hypothetical protein
MKFQFIRIFLLKNEKSLFGIGKAVFTILLLVLTFQCAKDENSIQPTLESDNLYNVESLPELDGVEVINGTVHFSDEYAFKKAVEVLIELDLELVDKWESDHSFVSLRSLYNQADDEYELYLENGNIDEFYAKWERVAVPNSINTGPTPYFGAFISTFLNKNLQVVIGSCLHQFAAKEVATYCGLSPKQLNELNIEELTVTEKTPITINGMVQNTLESRNTVTKNCVKKSNNNNNGSYSLETEMKLTEVKVAIGNGSYMRVGDVRLESVSKRKKTFGWFKKGAYLTMDGPIHVGDMFGQNWDIIVDEGPKFTQKLVKFYDAVAIGSNDNKQDFIDPTSVVFTSHQVPEDCVLED